MSLFLSTFCNKIDKKGRVSVPSPFRAILAAQPFAGIIAYSSFVNPCIEACGYERMTQLSYAIDALDPYSEERDAFATAILGNSVQLSFDSEGRIMLPENLLAYAKFNDAATFVGKGATFEIWEPTIFAAYAEKARTLAKNERGLLRLRSDYPEGERRG
jgi:MraZ protein